MDCLVRNTPFLFVSMTICLYCSLRDKFGVGDVMSKRRSFSAELPKTHVEKVRKKTRKSPKKDLSCDTTLRRAVRGMYVNRYLTICRTVNNRTMSTKVLRHPTYYLYFITNPTKG